MKNYDYYESHVNNKTKTIPQGLSSLIFMHLDDHHQNLHSKKPKNPNDQYKIIRP